jgi:hypothetical protein
MKVIGAGLPRTATLSQKVALEMIGVTPCYHMVDVLGDLDQVPLWQQALEGEAPWDEIFAGCQATVDWPGAFFYRELIDRHPDAKVVLSVRDAEGWERSMRDTIWGVLYGDIMIRDLSAARARVDPKWAAYTELMKEMWCRSGLLPGEEDADAESMRRAMETYNEQVKRAVPEDRLLVWRASDGWEPLCRFLGAQAPPAPFPHLNDAKQFAERVVTGSLEVLQHWWADQVPAPA